MKRVSERYLVLTSHQYFRVRAACQQYCYFEPYFSLWIQYDNGTISSMIQWISSSLLLLSWV